MAMFQRWKLSLVVSWLNLVLTGPNPLAVAHHVVHERDFVVSVGGGIGPLVSFCVQRGTHANGKNGFVLDGVDDVTPINPSATTWKNEKELPHYALGAVLDYWACLPGGSDGALHYDPNNLATT
ncbi:uncharacterized protein LY79DRAFT_584330 [Colletotrichum navitas]|uniref:Glucose-methanol-choline oxidoreductase N-terminal domain-containing protein n=1 Tax=Colletotrichum navitas TaxID=681940 RepID=A0AAD8PLM7_9PEZI|nr:uncharacterized protein LY79DRAFT_584330 [Colletotrichum navitas]KAK1569999.1 hypothetical protein LY79DRAFT_584330 [Colletotrichum navitas]